MLVPGIRTARSSSFAKRRAWASFALAVRVTLYFSSVSAKDLVDALDALHESIDVVPG